ncbi:hypothetical protein MN608_11445 [Microdochium nivale]|nr:hypothetical protein MN608_11445 [Microdochium nivale]
MSKHGESSAYIVEHEAPPSYESTFDESNHYHDSDSERAAGFRPTTHLSIETTGHDYSTMSWTGDMAVPVFRLDFANSVSATSQHNDSSRSSNTPAYLSLRSKKNSNSAALVRGDDPGARPIMSTVYRWGPGRDPRMRVYPASGSAVTIDDAVDKDKGVPQGGSEFPVNTHWVTSRSADMDTPYGRFEWRYGKRAERKSDDGAGADSLLVLEKVAGDSGNDSSSKTSRVRVAQLVRNAEYRTQDTTKYGGGNGGRLMIDLSPWMGDKGAHAADEIEAFVVCGALCMLKRETDRAKSNQMAVLT